MVFRGGAVMREWVCVLPSQRGGAVSQGAVLQGAAVQGAVVQGAVSQGAVLPSQRGGAVVAAVSQRAAVLQGAAVQGAAVQGAAVQGAAVQGAAVQVGLGHGWGRGGRARHGAMRRCVRGVLLLSLLGCVSLLGCERRPDGSAAESEKAALGAGKDEVPSDAPAPAPAPTPTPVKVELREPAMGTTVVFVAFTHEAIGESEARRALQAGLQEIRRLEGLMSTFRPDTELSRANANAGRFSPISPDTVEVIDKSLWAGKLSDGRFDITFHTLGDLWKFGSVAEPNPVPPSREEAARRASLLDYRLVELDREGGRVKVPAGRAIDLGGIAKGYAVDRAVAVLREHGLRDFLVQAGGDLYGAGRKPDGSPWVSGVQDPRGGKGEYFATLPLEDHAFSTAGDYARSFIYEGRRYHHIIDPKTGYPATACRSVTVWAPTALLADAIDDAVFILGPERGLELVESLDGVGALIVDADNRVWTSRRLQGKVRQLRPPTAGI